MITISQCAPSVSDAEPGQVIDWVIDCVIELPDSQIRGAEIVSARADASEADLLAALHARYPGA